MDVRINKRKPIMRIAEETGWMDKSGYDEIAKEDNKIAEIKWLSDELGIRFVGRY